MDDNVMRILQMVQDGTITAKEAEMLIAALRGETQAETAAKPKSEGKEESGHFGGFEKIKPIKIDLDTLGERISAAVSRVQPEKIVRRVQSQIRSVSRAGAHWSSSVSQRVKDWTDGPDSRPECPPGWSSQTHGHDQEFHLDPDAFVLIENPLGLITVTGIPDGPAKVTITRTAWAQREEDVKATMDRIRTEIHGTDSRLDVKASAPDGFREGVVDIAVQIPQSANVRAATRFGHIEVFYINGRTEAVTASGEANLHDLGGDVRAETASGSITVQRIGGSVNVATQSGEIQAIQIQRGLTANTASGDVVAREIEGGRVECKSVSGDALVEQVGREAPVDITVESVSGDATLRRAQGNIALKAVSGDVHASEISTSRVQAQTVSGDVCLRITEPVSGAIQVNTVSGDAHISFPEGSNMRVMLSTTSGDLRCDHDAQNVTATETLWTGQIGTGAGSLNVQTISGDTQITRA